MKKRHATILAVMGITLRFASLALAADRVPAPSSAATPVKQEKTSGENSEAQSSPRQPASSAENAAAQEIPNAESNEAKVDMSRRLDMHFDRFGRR